MNEETQDSNGLIVSLRVLNQMGASILSSHTIEQMIDTVYEHINQLMDAYSFAIGIYNATSGRFEFTGARENHRKLPAFSADAHNKARFSGWIFEHKKEILINDYENECCLYLPGHIMALQGMEPSSCMYVPLFIDKEITGILSVRTIVRNAYSARTMEILKNLAVFKSKAIENSRAVKNILKPAAKLPKSYILNPLSAREMNVLALLAKGAPNKAIASELYISPSTVKTHTLNIYQKLDAANRTDAILKAKDYGLID